MKKLLLTVFILSFSFLLRSQVVINEVSSASVSSFLDEDGDQEDWIEFYNTGNTAINMQGYTIARNENGNNNQWKFPRIFIKPHDYLTIFCSKKDRKTFFDHWEVPVYSNNPWKYYLGSSNPPANWRSIGFNDTPWLTGQGGIGYGDGDDSTVIPPVTSLFMRKTFTIADTSIIPTAAILLDFDDAFVAYLNDVEIARFNVGIYGDHPAYNTYAYDEHEAQMYQNGNFSAAYFVSPHIIDSALKVGTNVFSIQVHNYNNGMNDLSAIPYFLIGVNDTTVTYYPFPATVHLHTDFNLNSTGQILTLTDSSGVVVDQHTVGPMQINNTYGRRPDGANNWYYFDTPTPDTSNNTSAFYIDYASQPYFTLPAGFYTGNQLAGMTAANGTIRYTTDGKDPDQSSPAYSSPIIIDSTRAVRARTYSSNPLYLPSPVITNTYFINENISLPVVSLVSDPYNLFDYNYGIYVYGPGADMSAIPFQGANFWKGWERPANIEYFDQRGTQGFETTAGISIQGNYSKAWPQRGFTVKAKENYNGTKINYPLFPDKQNISSYKSFNIRNAGSDWNTTHMRDRFNQKNAQKSTSLDIMDGRPCVLFINGKYWGVYELREKQDKDYIESNSGVSGSKIDFLEFDGNIIEGGNAGFLSMVNFIGNNSMSDSTNYTNVKTMLDIENFCDYFITETYLINIDWLGTYTNNIKFWRPNDPPGKWRYMFWDTDITLGFAQSWWAGADTTNMLRVAINPPTSNPHSVMLRSLLNNTEFKNYFVDRYADLMNTIFLPNKMDVNAYAMRDEMAPEMARHFTKWGYQSPAPNAIGRSNDVPSWEANIDTMLQFAGSRIGIARDQIENQFSLVKQVNVTLDVQPAGAGKIKISTITPESLPWTGVYYDGVPVTITVTANPGYKFKYWQSPLLVPTPNSNNSIRLNVSTDDTFTAYFDALQNDFQVYPNPFNNTLTLSYTLLTEQQASIGIYNLLGQLVAEPITADAFQTVGVHTITIDANQYNLGTGIYFIKYKTPDFSSTIKLVRTKN